MAVNLNICDTNGTGMDNPRPTNNAQEKAKELVLVEWVDIISDDGWVVAEDCSVPTFYSVGWLEYQDDKVLKISTTLDFDDVLEEHKKREKPIGYAVTCFPAGCVTSIKYL